MNGYKYMAWDYRSFEDIGRPCNNAHRKECENHFKCLKALPSQAQECLNNCRQIEVIIRNPRQPKDSKIKEDSIEFQLAYYLLEGILRNKPDFKTPNLQSWARQIDLMMRLDKRRPEQIKKIIEWCQADNVPDPKTNFCWANNILSTKKLREHFDQLEMKMKKESPKKIGGVEWL